MIGHIGDRLIFVSRIFDRWCEINRRLPIVTPQTPRLPIVVRHPARVALAVAMEEGLRFAIREGGRTVGAGVVSAIIE